MEKASTVIRKLIIDKGSAKERLLACEIEIIFTLTITVPDGLNSKQEKIFQKLTRKPEIIVGDKLNVTSFKNTVRQMQNKTASKLIEEIYDLYLEIIFRQNNITE